MNQAHKADDYNLTQPSRLGRAGFESFKNEKDGRFYFHYNDEKGTALLFSQAYRKETDRDKGILSVIRNAVIEDRFERHPEHSGDGGYFFELRAANRQEIARSRVFRSVDELEQQRAFFRQNLSLSADDTTITPNRLVEKKNVEETISKLPTATAPSILASENIDLKNKIKKLEAQLETLQSTVTLKKELSEEPLRQVFRIEAYKNNTSERIHGQIIHPFSDDTQTFNGLDMDTIKAFMAAKLQTELAMVSHPMSEKQTSQPKPSLPSSPVAVFNLSDKSNILQGNQPFALTLTPLAHERKGVAVGQACLVEINVFNLDTRERYKILKKRSSIADCTEGGQKSIGVRIEPLVLQAGSYRLSLTVQVLSHEASEPNDNQAWQGGIILQIY